MAMNIMIQGTMSNAGKSLLAAGLCRVLKQDGYRVAPFKSQNMALNSFITKDGGEMGRAQVVQAEAAGIEPDTRMNPILLKPTTDVGSQVIVNGQVRGNMQAMEYFRRKRDYIPAVLEVMKFIYDHIIYAELNTKSDYCQVCGWDGEIQIVEDNGKLIWKCPKCGNTDQDKMNVARRTCGYIGTQFWNQGRTQEIRDRVLHL